MPLLAFAATLIGAAVAYNFGAYQAKAIVVLGASLAFCVAGNLALRRFSNRWALPAVCLCLAISFWKVRLTPIMKVFHEPPSGYAFFLVCLALSAVLIVFGIAGAKNWWFAAIVAIHFAMGVWVLRAQPKPPIDVFNAQMESADALARGENPYAIQISVGSFWDPKWYGSGMVENGHAKFGYPYPPLTLLMAMPGYALFSDTRYAQLLALSGTALLLGFGLPGLIPKLAACLYLFSPREFYVLEMSWTEPFIVLFMAATLVTAVRRPALLWIPLGLLLASKQYVVLLIPLVWLLMPRWRDYLSLIAKSAALALAVSLPFALWNLPAFWDTVVALQFHQPFRMDALSFSVTAVHRLGTTPPQWLPFLMMGLATAAALRWNPRTPAGFAAAAALALFLFVSFNKQAFANYYSLIIGTLCGAVAIGCGAASESSGYKMSS